MSVAAETLGGERLAELLSVTSEAPDFATAASFLVEQLATAAGASRACFLALDPERHALVTVAVHGFRTGAPSLAVPLGDRAHPLVVAALSLCPVTDDGAPSRRLGLPFARWTAIPFPQPQFRGAPALLGDRETAALQADGFSLCTPAADDRRRIGHAPLGVALLEGVESQATIGMLAHAALLAGPVLSRMIAVDEYRRSAERLDQQRDLLTAIINSLPDPIVITDAARGIVVQNRRAEQLLVARVDDPAERRRAVERNTRLLASHLAGAALGGEGTRTAGDLTLVDPERGTELLFEVSAHPLRSGNARDASFVTVLRDLTDLRRAAGELERQVQRVRLAEVDARRERDRLNLILENVADPILVTDASADIILMNRQAERLFDLGAGEAGEAREAGEADHAVRSNDATFARFIGDFTRSGEQARRARMRLVQPGDETELPVEIVSEKILDARSEPLAIVSVLHDLTKQVENERLYHELKSFSAQLEERIRAATADLAAQNQRLQWQAKELERASRLKSDFLASMSHELRTPINALLGYTALLLDRIYGDVNTRQEDSLKRIQGAAQHLLALINDILDLAKIEAGKMPLHLEPMQLRLVVAEISQQIEPLVKKKALAFECEMPADVPLMFTDHTKVKQILLNLLSNAVKFTHEGRVRLQVDVHGERVRVVVEDTGIGIHADDLDAIWEDFRQVDQSRTREFGGTGLGLSITRKLVEQLGGTIEVRSVHGEGSTFTVELPLRSRQRTGQTPAVGTETVSVADAPAARSRRAGDAGAGRAPTG